MPTGDADRRSIANVATRLTLRAASRGDAVAVATAADRYRPGRYRQGSERPYRTLSFRDLESRVNSVAAGLQAMGVGPGTRVALLVRFGEDFIALTFALLRAGATLVLIDPGMPRRHLIDCLAAARPDGFVAIPQAQLIVRLLRRRFPQASKNVTVGRRFGLLPRPSYSDLLRRRPEEFSAPETSPRDPAAVIFTTGSTGPPKGVLYTHSTFQSQIDLLVSHYGIEPGGTDLACFPLFGLFDAAMGTTAVIPDMDPTRPADVEPPRLLDAVERWQINQAFGSPALWRTVTRYSDATGRRCPSLRLVLSAGAAVPPETLAAIRRMIHPDGLVHTPYGATESLPVASIESREVLGETAAATAKGKGTCVGRRFPAIDWKIIAITDGPVASIDKAEELPQGQIGELMVRGPVVSRRYETREDQNSLHKVVDGEEVWHRIGDVGYLDAADRFWYCGRKGHRVRVREDLTLFTEPCEAVINQHPDVVRSALVGVPLDGGFAEPVIVLEVDRKKYRDAADRRRLTESVAAAAAARSPVSEVRRFLVYPTRLPTDIRHNSKIFREVLAQWATAQVQANRSVGLIARDLDAQPGVP